MGAACRSGCRAVEARQHVHPKLVGRCGQGWRLCAFKQQQPCWLRCDPPQLHLLQAGNLCAVQGACAGTVPSLLRSLLHFPPAHLDPQLSPTTNTPSPTLCRLANFVLPEALRVRGYDAAAEEEEEADLEARFSDDEAVRPDLPPSTTGRSAGLVVHQALPLSTTCR